MSDILLDATVPSNVQLDPDWSLLPSRHRRQESLKSRQLGTNRAQFSDQLKGTGHCIFPHKMATQCPVVPSYYYITSYTYAHKRVSKLLGTTGHCHG